MLYIVLQIDSDWAKFQSILSDYMSYCDYL